LHLIYPTQFSPMLPSGLYVFVGCAWAIFLYRLSSGS